MRIVIEYCHVYLQKRYFSFFFLNSFLSPHHLHSVKRQLCSVAAVVAITSNWIVYSSLSLHFYIGKGTTVITKFFWLNLLIALSCYFDKLLLTLALSILCMTTMQLPSINFCCTLNSQRIWTMTLNLVLAGIYWVKLMIK